MRRSVYGSACVAVLLLAAATAAAAADGASDPRQILARATQLHQSGDIEGAIREYRAFLERYPGAAEVHANLGVAYARLGRNEEAIAEYQRGLKLGSAADNVSIRFNLALAYYKAARFPEAEAALKRVLAAKPDHWNAALLLANCQLSAGRNREVIATLTPFEARHGDDRARAFLLGTAQIREGERERGQQLIDVILRGGDSAEARFMMGTAQLLNGDPAAAADEFRRAIELNPRLPSLNASLGRALTEMSRPDEAVEYFRKELEVNPNDFDAHLHLGMHLQKAEQDYAGALRHYEHALRVRPGAPNARYQIGLVYLLTEKQDAGLRLIEGVVRDVPVFLEGHATLVRLYYRLGRREDAERHRARVEELQASRAAEGQAVIRPPSR